MQLHVADLEEVKTKLIAKTGDYNHSWHDRTISFRQTKSRQRSSSPMVLQDWSVGTLMHTKCSKPFPANIKKHLFYHNGAHVHLNNWQSIDFRWVWMPSSLKLLAMIQAQLPTVIWQDTGEQSWTSSRSYQTAQRTFPLGDGWESPKLLCDRRLWARRRKAYPTFLTDLTKIRAQQVTIDLPIAEDYTSIRKASSPAAPIQHKQRLASAQLMGAERISPTLSSCPIRPQLLDNGRYHMLDNLTELPFKEAVNGWLQRANLTFKPSWSHKSNL